MSEAFAKICEQNAKVHGFHRFDPNTCWLLVVIDGD